VGYWTSSRARFGEEILDALDSKENKRLLNLSRKNGMIRLGDKIDAAMEKLEDDTRKVVSSRKQAKAKHCIECYDGDDDEDPKLPRYIAFDSQMGTL
jgi:flagellar motility protein MotE (MotC chaperone)